ncbi:M15 family metallopeptidase [Vibrio maerlii]|uniref:M15 family metallopeptidase n=1 Tax=Vibrio maerlii TaxID=2231648 RepID=UPI000E3E3FE0|nr:M15 family metallopeptidase [Vibrio maerlii]
MSPEQLTGKFTTHLKEVVVGQKSFFVHQDVTQDLLSLKKSATQAGFDLCIASGFREFSRQAAIWNAKYDGERPILDNQGKPVDPDTLTDEDKVLAIMRWSALPGASRHHWGTDFDLYARDRLPDNTTLQLEPWEYLTGHQAEFYTWLREAAPMHGFYFPYDQDRGGVAVEPWHLSHKQTATIAMTQLSLSVLAKELERAKEISGRSVILSQLESLYNRFVVNVS